MKLNISKKIISALAISTLLAACGGADRGNSSFQLSGTFTNAAKGDMVYFEELAPGAKVVLDSAVIDDKGNFSFTHAAPSAGFYRVKATEQNFAMLVLDSSQKITLTGDFKNIGNTYQTTGSEDTKLFLEFNALGREVQQRTDSMQQAFQALVGTTKMDSLKMDSLNKVFGDIYNSMIDSYQNKFAGLVTKAKSSLAVLAGIQQLNPDKYLDLYKEVEAALSAKYPRSKYLANLKKDIYAFEMQSQKANSLKVGATPADFSLPTPDGKMIALSSFKGKVVLVDFWASWCGPCRKENPNVVAMYKKYHNKGFDILGVSLDDDKTKWMKAYEADGLVWNHVSDLKGWECTAAKLYGITAIPFTLLLDKEGKVVAKGLRGEELEEKVVEALAAK
jgi:thiol-disulfide isomerase/thioredoxin